MCEYATTDSRNLMKHKGTHSGDKPYICDYCAKAYTRKASLDNHRRLHTGERPFKCDFEVRALNRENGSLGCPTRSDTNSSVH